LNVGYTIIEDNKRWSQIQSHVSILLDIYIVSLVVGVFKNNIPNENESESVNPKSVSLRLKSRKMITLQTL
jgi:hypothetical protein